MDENNLHDLLEKLHSQIENSPTIGKEDLAQLRDLEADIRALLERSNAEGIEQQPTLFQRLEESVGVFEVTHPTLAVTITDVMVILSNAGI
jgi:hypothetical protein